MTPGPPSLEDLVRAICAGRPIDWGVLERDASPGFLNKLAALRVVESIAHVHRTAVPEGTPAVDETPSGTGAAPERWGHLELLDHLASGAFGDVYRAWDSGLDREVALKLLRRSLDADAHADEALEEGRLLAKVRHPNVVTVHGAGRFDGRAGVWMEFLHGRTLADEVAHDGPLPPTRVASIGVALCHALSAVHRASLVHSDIKPENVMLADDGRIVLMDFGASGAVRHAGLQHAGTPRYLAPELAAGGSATVQSDVYSLGATLRYLLTGNAIALPDYRPSNRVERRLLTVIARATDSHPRTRFETAEAFARALASLPPRRVKGAQMAAAGGLVLALLALLWVTWQSSVGEDARQRALEQSWQLTTPTRPSLTPDQSQMSYPTVQGTFVSHGLFASTSEMASRQEESVVTLDPTSGDTRVWATNAAEEGHAESPAISADRSLVTYSWLSTACRCSSLRAVDRAGRTRTLISAPDVVAIRTGATMSDELPVLIGRSTMQYELALVNTTTGAKRTLRTLPVDPTGFSLSPDGAYLAYAVPGRSAHGSARDIIVHEVSTSREWPLLDSAADRLLPVWTPSGNHIFYVESSGDGASLRAVKVMSGHQASRPSVLKREFVKPLGMGFFDDETFAYSNWSGTSEVMVVEAATNGSFQGQKPRRLSDGGATMPAWSPDGQWLAWSEAREIRVSRGDGAIVRVFRPELNIQIYPTWSANSRQLAFWDVSDLGALLKVADVETGTTLEILRLSHPQIEGAFDLGWSGPRKLLIDALTPRHITAVDIATGDRRQVYETATPNTRGSFYVSPDGHSLAFCEGLEHPAPIHIMPLHPNGISLTRPAKAEGEGLLGWWPDGRSLLETRTPGPDEPTSSVEICRLPLDGTTPERLGVTGTNIVYASIAPDARRIAYSTQTSFGSEVWFLKAQIPH